MTDTPIGTNSPNYTLVPGDLDANIFCRVTATNAVGSAQAFSNTVGPVAAAVEWTPASLPGLLFWYEARNPGVVTSGGNLVSVPDLSGNGNTLAASGTIPFNATGFNGTPAFDFAASGGALLQTSSPTVVMTAVATGSFVVVGQMKAGTVDYGRLLSYVASADSNDYTATTSSEIFGRDVGANTIVSARGGIAISDSILLATNYRFGVVFDGVNATHYINNAAGSFLACSAVFGTPGRIAIGALALTGGAEWAGPVAMVFGGNQVWDSTMRANLDAWIVSELGL